ncbi:MAG: Ppx/GppA family phosphatase [Solirubrobacterales bacterium]
MRIAAIDIGSNSTRLLVADVVDGRVEEKFRRSTVTRLGDGVDSSGRLTAASCERVHEVLTGYSQELNAAGCERVGGIATSAVRDAANGAEFAAQILDRHGIAIDVIDGNREAELTFAGVATGSAFADGARTLVIDIGGGSTEFIVGERGELRFNTSTDIGAVRYSERFLHSDPPTSDELHPLIDESTALLELAIPVQWRSGIARSVAVAGTPTVLAAVDQALDPFDPWKVHDYAITRTACDALLGRLAALPLTERRNVIGLHPDRAPTIVAGAAILQVAMRVFALDQVVVSERDLLYGIALKLGAET